MQYYSFDDITYENKIKRQYKLVFKLFKFIEAITNYFKKHKEYLFSIIGNIKEFLEEELNIIEKVRLFKIDNNITEENNNTKPQINLEFCDDPGYLFHLTGYYGQTVENLFKKFFIKINKSQYISGTTTIAFL